MGVISWHAGAIEIDSNYDNPGRVNTCSGVSGPPSTIASFFGLGIVNVNLRRKGFPGRPHLAILFVAIAGCGGSELAEVQEAPTTVFSSSQLDQAPTLQLQRLYRVGLDSVYFARVTDIAVDSSNNVYVLDGVSATISVFDSVGRFIRRFGKRGDGPGELRNPSLITAAHDSVITFDRGKLNLFTAKGEYVGRLSASGDIQRTTAIKLTSDGLMLRMHSPLLHSDRPSKRDSIWIRRLDIFGRALGPILAGLPLPVMEMKRGRAFAAVGAAVPILSIDPVGRVYEASGEAFRVQVPSIGGRNTSELISADPAPVAATTSDYDEEIADRSKAIADMGVPPNTSVLQKAKRVKYRPVLGDIVASREGSFLAQRLDIASGRSKSHGTAPWEFIGMDRSIVGRVQIDRRFRPQFLSGARVVGIETDDLGMQTVVAYRIVASNGGGRGGV